MAGKRQARLNEQFRREIVSILRTQVRDPRIGLPTVTGVEVTPDLWMAKVFVRPDPTGGGEGLLEGLRAASPYIRAQLGQVLAIRRIPELRFQVDRTQEAASRIHALLAEALADRPEADVAEEAEGTEDAEGAAADAAEDAEEVGPAQSESGAVSDVGSGEETPS
jgi:ribosome-binding factor A